jgi:thiol-disulfide isomerase/thioredoxin
MVREDPPIVKKARPCPLIVAALLVATFAPTKEISAAGKTPPRAAEATRDRPSKAAKPTRATIITPEEMRAAIGRHKGSVVILHLWASWCVPCLAELPIMGQFALDMKGKGVELLSISLDDPTDKAAETVGRLINQRAFDALFNAIVKIEDPDAFVTSVDPEWEGAIPALFAYDRGGRLRQAWVGEATRAHLDKMVADVGGEKAK